jgi:predicted site-specific integrase-resolvase
MADLEQRVTAVEARSEKVLQLLQQAVSAIFSQRQRLDELEGRLRAHTLLTATVLQLAHRLDPEGFENILALLEQSKKELERSNEDQAVVNELRQILGTLRSF